MRKVILMLVLAVVSNSAVAEWNLIGESGGTTIYVDGVTSKKVGNLVDASWLSDMKPWTYGGTISRHHREPTPRGTMTSLVFKSQYDCLNNQYRIIERDTYSDHMAVGQVEHKVVNGEWLPVKKGGDLWQLTFNYFCQ